MRTAAGRPGQPRVAPSITQNNGRPATRRGRRASGEAAPSPIRLCRPRRGGRPCRCAPTDRAAPLVESCSVSTRAAWTPRPARHNTTIITRKRKPWDRRWRGASRHDLIDRGQVGWLRHRACSGRMRRSRPRDCSVSRFATAAARNPSSPSRCRNRPKRYTRCAICRSGKRYELRRDDSRTHACMEVAVSAVLSIVLGLLGGIGVERLRNA
jgi:hypothetical protein